MITLERASRWYGQVIGLNDVTCSIGPGITALLGPNGAGKSSMLKLITGQLRPTTGKVTMFGLDPFANPNVYNRMGYCPEIESAYDEVTGRQFVSLMATLAGLRGETHKRSVTNALQLVDMESAANRKMGGYSKGMRQRIKVAQAIVHDPQVLILDEPFNGLDPVSRRDMGLVLSNLANQGKCVLLSSHILHEVEQMTSTVLMLYKGRLLASGNVREIRGLIDRFPHKISVESDRVRELAEHLISLESVIGVKLDSTNRSRLEIETSTPDRFYSDFPAMVLEHKFQITRFYSPDNNLESVFHYLIQG